MTIDTNLTWTPMSEQALARASMYEVGTEYTAAGMVIIETKSGSSPQSLIGISGGPASAPPKSPSLLPAWPP